MTERGSVGIVVLSLVAVALALVTATVDIARVSAALGQAQAASDAAALAAAPVTYRPFGASGSAYDEAVRFAGANGAGVVMCRCRPDPSPEPRTVVVRAEIVVETMLFGAWSVTATGRAEFDPRRLRDSALE
ncbi:MAG: hypothetical protein KJP12_05090 [Acidimicrobiia bacterium]|nr:hypothetical protein [Acidimicrobiia bacterium]NNK91242.1 hypothetical protein [Acidimicrobiia bacterium]